MRALRVLGVFRGSVMGFLLSALLGQALAQTVDGAGITFSRACSVLIESKPGSKSLFCRDSGRITGVHLSWKRSNDTSSVTIGGRIHADAVTIDDDITPFADESDIRRLRLDGDFRFGKKWRVLLDANIGANNFVTKNVWLSYKGDKGESYKLGRFVVPLDGEYLTSSNDIKLMERSLAVALASQYMVGGAASMSRDQWQLSVGLFAPLSRKGPLAFSENQQALVGRFAYYPVKSDQRLLQFALGVERRWLEAGAAMRVRTRPEFGLSSVRLLDTSSLAGVSAYSNYIFETAYMQGPLLIRAKHIARVSDASVLGDPRFNGSAIEAAFVLTGEDQRFKSGKFKSIRPQNSYGAFELAARYSRLDLNDGLVAGGAEDNWTLGANWYLTSNMRLMANYIHAETDPGANGQTESVDALSTRFQINF
jgi:phosphate-selective porin OprO and OprP